MISTIDIFVILNHIMNTADKLNILHDRFLTYKTFICVESKRIDGFCQVIAENR